MALQILLCQVFDVKPRTQAKCVQEKEDEIKKQTGIPCNVLLMTAMKLSTYIMYCKLYIKHGKGTQ